MGEQTKIPWADKTFNPWWGCTRVSPACGMPVPGHEDEPHGVCYAETWSKRTGFKIWGQDVGRRFFSAEHWREPEKWNKQAKRDGTRPLVFCGSMCDILEDREDLNWTRCELWDLIAKTPELIWMLTTKRPQNFKRMLPADWARNPPGNVWAIVTVELQEYTWRIDAIKQIPFAVHGVSCEPLLGPVKLPEWFLAGGQRAWCIGGGESGHGARPTHPAWARQLRDDCRAAGVPFHWKQWGQYRPIGCAEIDSKDFDHELVGEASVKRTVRVWPDGRVDDGNEQREGRGAWFMERVTREVAGHLLDGRVHRHFPAARYVT